MLLLLLHSLNQMSIISIFIGFQMKQFVHSVEMSVPPVDIMHLWGHPSPGVYSLPQAESAVVTHWLTVYMSLMEIHAMCTGDIYSVHKKKFQHQFFIPVQETPHPLPLSLSPPQYELLIIKKKEKSFPELGLNSSRSLLGYYLVLRVFFFSKFGLYVTKAG